MGHNCENCKRRAYAEKYPNSFKGKLWYWHTKWCPGWKAYQKQLKAAEKGAKIKI